LRFAVLWRSWIEFLKGNCWGDGAFAVQQFDSLSTWLKLLFRKTGSASVQRFQRLAPSIDMLISPGECQTFLAVDEFLDSASGRAEVRLVCYESIPS